MGKAVYRIGDKSGFTIVELLIVVVVIAILAAITIVSYNGITNQAHDTAVKNDLSVMKKKLEIYKAENGAYPNGLTLTSLPGFRASKGSYMVAPVTDHNLIYCMKGVSGNVEDYSVVAYSKSGKKFRVAPDRGIEEYTTNWTNQTVACEDSMPVYTHNFRGYAGEITTDGPWRAWAGGNS